MTSPFHLGKHKIDTRVWVAPLSGLTDLPFRRCLMRQGAKIVVSEMVASEQLVKGSTESLRRASGAGEVDPLIIQLAGREAHWMGEGARAAVAAGAEIVDINMGCPARKVTKGLSGSALMRDPDHALDLIKATVDAVDVPVTLKTRLGWDDEMRNAPEIAARAEQAGVQMFVIHGRTRCQFYDGEADWHAVSETKRAVSKPVLVNGDILTGEDARNAMAQSGADGVMVGRGLVGRPWRIAEFQSAIDGAPHISEPSREEKLDIIAAHYADILSFYGKAKGLRHARRHMTAYVDAAITDAGFNADSFAAERSVIATSLDAGAVMGAMQTVICGAAKEAA